MSIGYRLTKLFGAFYLYICMLMIEWVHYDQKARFELLPIGMSVKLQHLTEGIEIQHTIEEVWSPEKED